MASEPEAKDELKWLVGDLTKAVLRSSQLDAFQSDQKRLMGFLAEYCAAQAMRRETEKKMAITADCAARLFNTLYLNGRVNESIRSLRGMMRKSDGNLNIKEVFSSADGPFVSQRTLRDQLSSMRINTYAFVDAVELCRFLDGAQRVPTPFGAVNVLHFLAVYLSLCQCSSLFELIEILFRISGTDELCRLRVMHLWSLIDAHNRSEFERVINEILQRPGITLPLLLEFYPKLRYIGMEEPPEAERPASTGRVSPRCVTYNEDDSGGLGDEAPATATMEDREEKPPSESDNELEIEDTRDMDFWARLTS